MSPERKAFFSTMLSAIETNARSVLACIGIAGTIAIYIDFRGVIEQQFQGYQKLSENITTLTEEIKKTSSAVRENSFRLEHLEREHEAIRNAKP